MFSFFKEIDILKKYDCFFLTYDEPEKEQRWQKIKKAIPHAKWVDGVEGFDRAHKTCASQSETDRLIIIDGDNVFTDKKPSLKVSKKLARSNYVLSYSSQNNINGLTYGNGGVKSWPRDVLLNSKTHEEAEDEESAVDFCFKVPYYQIAQAPTKTIVNITPYQAFRAGYREGVKMALVQGLVPELDLENDLTLKKLIPKSNFFRLKVWLEVGRDVKNGEWALYGARRGLLELMENPKNLENIRSYDWFENLWAKEADILTEAIEENTQRYGEKLGPILGTSLREMNEKESRDFKEGMVNPKREGIMIPGLGEENA